MSTSHKTARTPRLWREFTNSPWTGRKTHTFQAFRQRLLSRSHQWIIRHQSLFVGPPQYFPQFLYKRWGAGESNPHNRYPPVDNPRLSKTSGNDWPAIPAFLAASP